MSVCWRVLIAGLTSLCTLATVSTWSSTADACTVWTNENGLELHFPPGEPVEYWIQTDGSADIPGDEDFDAIHEAFAAWGSVLCGDEASGLTFTFAGLADVEPRNFDPRRFRDRKNMVAFINEDWGESDADVLARARILWDSETGEITEFGIALNDEYTDWSTDPAGDPGLFDIQSVLMRQIGLSFGLGDSTFEDAVMFPAFSPGSSDRRGLSNDDTVAVCDLYEPGRQDFSEAPDEAACERDFHPGAVPDDGDPDPGPEAEPDAGPDDLPDAEPEAPANLGAGENCQGTAQCADGLECGCPLESCAANFCFTPEVEAPLVSDEGGCAVVTVTAERDGGWALFAMILILGLRRRRS